MKKILLGILALGCTSAFAFHPDDQERLFNIGTGTKIKVLKDINIVPNARRIKLGRHCHIELWDEKQFDRVLAADSILKVVGSAGHYPDADVLYLDNMSIKYIYCTLVDDKRPTIELFKNETVEVFEITLADPTRI